MQKGLFTHPITGVVIGWVKQDMNSVNYWFTKGERNSEQILNNLTFVKNGQG